MKAFFVFSGQGAQAVGMGKDLYDACPEAKAVFDRADEVLGYSLKEICFEGPAEKLTETRYCQVAIYTMSCAALDAFRTAYPAVEPLCCAGLSLGEYAALYAGGAFSFDNGLKLLAQRAAFMDEDCKATCGTMAPVIGAEMSLIEEICAKHDVDIANYNSPAQTVISGERAKVEAAAAEFKERGVRKVIVLNVAGAFHSRLMKPASQKLAAVLADAEVAMPRVPVFHNFTGRPAASVEELRANLAGQVAGSVRWEACARAAVAMGADTMIEFGPGNVLTGLMHRTVPEVALVNINSLETLKSFTL